jgi:heme/copper-type cytochrome/quinol oxidase subunit 2
MKASRAIGVAVLALTSAPALASILAGANDATPPWVWICVGAAAAVFGAIVFSVIAYRPPADDAQQCKTGHELIRTSVPIAIVIAAATPALINITPTNHFVVTSQAAHRADNCISTNTTSHSNPIPTAIPVELPKIPAVSCAAQR